jgi:hypothetical protein
VAPPGAAGPARTADPDDTFLLPADDPRVPTFMRALRAGKDSLLLGGWLRPGFVYVADTQFNDDDAEGFEFADARLIGLGDMTIAHGLGASFRFDFDVNRGNFTVRDVYGSLTYRKDLIALDVGQLKTPLSLSLLQTQAKMQFPTNSLVSQLSFDRDIGAQLRTDFPIGPVWFHLAAMLANGDGGFRQRRNIDDEFLYVGRLEIAPFGRMERTEPDLADSDFQLTAGFSAGRNGALGNDLGLQDAGATETKIEGDLRAWLKGASLRGEYLRAFRGDTADSPGYQRYGFAVQAGYVLPIPIQLPLFELVARWQQVDVNTDLDGTEGADYVVDNTETRILQFGGNVYIAKHAVKLHLMYQLTDLLEGPRVDDNGDVLIGDAFMTFIQFAWL